MPKIADDNTPTMAETRHQHPISAKADEIFAPVNKFFEVKERKSAFLTEMRCARSRGPRMLAATSLLAACATVKEDL